jgi:NADPH-dependent 2,4-dienoyl-CoA reductase/sulfur reductase-like enzyme
LIGRDVDVAVVGGGAAGLAAAVRAKQRGVGGVLILERSEELGGVLPQCIHTGFGLHYFKENLTGPEYISKFIKRARDLGIECKLETMVLRITPSREVLAANSDEGLLKLRAKAIVLAMGCRERTRGALGIPGTRPAGIFTAGTAQRLMDIEGYMPGRRVVILGSGDVGLIMARRLAMEGAKVEAVVEIMPYPGGSDRNVVQCLEDFEIPLLLEHTVTFVHGAERVDAVTVAKVDGSGRPIGGTERLIKCDTLMLSVGLIPESELPKGAGIQLDPATGGPLVDERRETSIRGIFACGNTVHVYDLVDHVTQAGEIAGASAARYVSNKLPRLRRKIYLKAGKNVRYVVPQIISGENPVTLYVRVREPARDVRVSIGKRLSVPRRVVKPSELVVIELAAEELERLEKRDELVVSVEEGVDEEGRSA